MLALQVENIRDFMTLLFQGDMFDRFHVRECEAATFTTMKIDGRRCDGWYDTDEKAEDGTGAVTWRQLKPFVYGWIKGKKTPQRLKIDFFHYMANGDAGSLRIQYEKERLCVFTGYMQLEFSLDKSPQQQWDENCLSFLKKNNVISTQLD